MLKFVIACICIVSWQLAIVATWAYFNHTAPDPTSQPYVSLTDLAVIWAVALGSGKYVKDRP